MIILFVFAVLIVFALCGAFRFLRLCVGYAALILAELIRVIFLPHRARVWPHTP